MVDVERPEPAPKPFSRAGLRRRCGFCEPTGVSALEMTGHSLPPRNFSSLASNTLMCSLAASSCAVMRALTCAPSPRFSMTCGCQLQRR